MALPAPDLTNLVIEQIKNILLGQAASLFGNTVVLAVVLGILVLFALLLLIIAWKFDSITKFISGWIQFFLLVVAFGILGLVGIAIYFKLS